MRKLFLIVFIACLFIPSALGEELPPLPKGPLFLSGVTSPEQLTPEYWISRIENPDALIKTPAQLAEFNRDIRGLVKDRVDVFSLSQSRRGQEIKDVLKFEYETLSHRYLFDDRGQRITKDYFTGTIEPRLGLDQIPNQIQVKWGVATRATSVRALPTERKMLEEVGDVEFDQLQYTLIKAWTPVAVFQSTRGGSWYYVQAPYVRGWVQSSDIALFDSREEMAKYVQSEKFLTVVGESAAIYLDPVFSEISGRVSMGTYLPLAQKNENYYVIYMPLRDAKGKLVLNYAYVRRNPDVYEGFLPYTQRNAIKQAFKLLGARYGWGGQYNGRDCSGFTHDVFLSFGIAMPRNSGHQAFVGTQRGHFKAFEDFEKKIDVLNDVAPGITLLRMPLHMMLYLGEVDGRHYIMHSTWAERVGYDPLADEKNRINQVVVSDLSLNGKSYLGPLFARLTSINEIE